MNSVAFGKVTFRPRRCFWLLGAALVLSVGNLRGLLPNDVWFVVICCAWQSVKMYCSVTVERTGIRILTANLPKQTIWVPLEKIIVEGVFVASNQKAETWLATPGSGELYLRILEPDSEGGQETHLWYEGRFLEHYIESKAKEIRSLLREAGELHRMSGAALQLQEKEAN